MVVHYEVKEDVLTGYVPQSKIAGSVYMNMLHDRRGEIAIVDILFMGLLVVAAAVTSFFIINLSVYKSLFLFATGIIGILTLVNISYGLFFVVFFMMFPNLMPRQMFGLVGINPFNLIFIAVLVMVALRLVLRSSYIGFREPIYLPLILIFFLQAIAIFRFQNVVDLQNIERFVWLSRYAKPMQFIIIMILIINFMRLKELPYIAGIIIVGFAATGGLLLYLWIKYGLAMTIGLQADAQHILWSNPILGHKVNWATMFTLAFFFALAMIGQKFRRYNFLLNALAMISLVLMGFMIAISLARVAYFCILIGLLYFYWKKGRVQLFAIVALLAIIVPFMPDIIRMRAIQNIPTSFDATMINEFLSGRLEVIWIPAFKAFMENPIFGRGLNGAGIYFLGQAHLMSPHSGYLSTVCDMGLIGLAVMVVVFFMFWKHATIIYRNTNNTLTRRLALACKTQILIMIFSNITSDHSFLQQPVVVAPFFLSVGILFALYRGELEKREAQPETLQQEESDVHRSQLAHLPVI